MGVETIAEELDRLYQFDMDKYLSECNLWKKHGYRIFRNSDGKHKVVASPQKARMDKLNEAIGRDGSDIYNAFGGIFGDIFSDGGKWWE